MTTMSRGQEAASRVTRVVTWAAGAGFSPLWLGLYAGAALVALSERVAATDAGSMHFLIFWAGMFAFTIPLCVRLCRSACGQLEHAALLCTLALFDALPKWLRSPDHLLFYDELAHWRQSDATIARGTLFLPNPMVPIVKAYPGLHALTAVLHALSGLSSYQIALLLLVLLHALALQGVYALIWTLVRAARPAAIGALLYSTNPGFLYFDAMFAYESLAIVLFIWTIVCVARAEQREARSQRAIWLAPALALGLACIVTHHLSSYMLALVCLLICGCALRLRLRGYIAARECLPLWCFTGCLVLATVLWTVGVAGAVAGYLGPEVQQSLHDLPRLFGAPALHRTLFAASTTPSYERWAALLSPAIAGLGALVALGHLARSRVRLGACGQGLVLLGLLYFASFPLLLTAGGNEAARRSWSFIYLGLAVLLAFPADRLLRAAERRTRRRRRLARSGLCLCCMILLVGNVAMNTNEVYRFPGPVVVGSDARTLTAELLAGATWFRTAMGPNRPLIADRDDALAFAAFGDAWIATGWSGLPIWQLYLSADPPSGALLRTLQRDRYDYLVVDPRIAQALPRIGYYIARDEPRSGTRRTPPPATALSRYARLPWAIEVYSSDTLAIYRLDYAALRDTWHPVAG